MDRPFALLFLDSRVEPWHGSRSLRDPGFINPTLVQVDLMTMNKIKWLVHHLNPTIKQVQAIKFQCSNQPMLQGERIKMPKRGGDELG